MKIKRTLCALLGIIMILSVMPMAFTVSADEAESTANATYYTWRRYSEIIGEDFRGETCDYTAANLKKFDSTIDKMLASSVLWEELDNVTSFNTSTNGAAFPDHDDYLVKWTGKMTAEKAGTFTVLGEWLDNNVVMKVDGVKVFEYWGASHWWYGPDKYCFKSGDPSFTVKAGETVDVEIYFAELDGGQRLELVVSEDDGETKKSFSDAGLTFNLKQQIYYNSYYNLIPFADNNGGAGCLTIDQNFKYAEGSAVIKKIFEKTGSAVITGAKDNGTTVSSPIDNIKNNIDRGDDYYIEYDGWLSVKQSGTYYFGTTKLDNGFYFEIDGQRVYEVFARDSWNDSPNFYKTGDPAQFKGIKLEAGKVYPFKSAFLEFGGGEGLNVVCMIDNTNEDAQVYEIEQVVIFSATHEHNYVDGVCACGDTAPDIPVTGDSAVVLVLISFAAILGTVIAVKRRRKA